MKTTFILGLITAVCIVGTMYISYNAGYTKGYVIASSYASKYAKDAVDVKYREIQPYISQMVKEVCQPAWDDELIKMGYKK